MSDVKIHPLVDGGVPQGSDSFAGGTLKCLCTTDAVEAEVSSQVAHNHACGCTKCWKPEGADFSVVAVVPTDKVKITKNGQKLKVVDPSALIQRNACTVCGVHIYGPVEKQNHPFTGLSFIHPERFTSAGAAAPTFAAFVSSVIEAGVHPDKMDGIRSRLRDLALAPYDCLNPPLMDYIATFVAKQSGVLA